ncbi:MAG: ABC transporter substrate-binding protein [Oscillospiraceae bacterium]|jgi:iron complex transport system substrate-binding protein|nr:ABC transporter substrate-binding protein [Oscillospiraceae bacterium]
MQKTISKMIALLSALLFLSACGASGVSTPKTAQAQTQAKTPRRVVSLYASYSAAWLAAGGSLAGVTDDAVNERHLDVGGAALVGSLTRPSLEKILALEPDLILASPDVPGQLALQAQFLNLQIDARYYGCDTFEAYKVMMEDFLSSTGRDDLREKLIGTPEAQIKQAKVLAQGKTPRSVLLLRANSSGVQVKSEGTVAAEILRDLGAVNIAQKEPSLLRELSLEIILRENPQFIFVVPQGIDDAQTAIDALDPSWRSLTGQFIALPKDLYHYKPNERWGEAYAQLAAILYD